MLVIRSERNANQDGISVGNATKIRLGMMICGIVSNPHTYIQIKLTALRMFAPRKNRVLTNKRLTTSLSSNMIYQNGNRKNAAVGFVGF